MDSMSPRYNHHHHQISSPRGSGQTQSHNNNGLLQSPRPITRSETNNPYPTTFIQADTSSFKQVVQMLTGSTQTTNKQPPSNPTHHSIKSIPVKKQQHQSGFKLYERRNSLKNLNINPVSGGFSMFSRKPEILSPSILDFPSLVLSPVTPLIPDPFDRSSTEAEEQKAIKEKGFYLHPSPVSTPRDAQPPRLLPLFPTTSPRAAAGPSPSSSSASTSASSIN